MNAKHLKKALCFLFLLLLIFVFSACGGRDPLLPGGITSLELDKKGTVQAVIEPDVRTLGDHKGENLYFYEVLPGETITDALLKSPVADAKVGAVTRLNFSLFDGERSRLYSSFVAAFADGSLAAEDAKYIQNPEILSTAANKYLWEKHPNGLVIDDPAAATAAGATHAMVKTSLSALLSDAAGSISFGGKTYPINENEFARLDALIAPSCKLGMQVSLSLDIDTEISAEQFTAIADALASRYTAQENGTVTALYLGFQKTDAPADAAKMTAAASLALTSRVAGGRVYAVAPAADLTAIKAFFKDIGTALSTMGDLPFGAAVSPDVTDAPAWASREEGDAFSLNDLPLLKDFFNTLAFGVRPAYFSVCDILFSAEDEDLQAVSYIYAYRMAINAGAETLFYGAQASLAHGLTDEEGNARKILSFYKNADRGLDQMQESLCSEIIGDPWDSLNETQSYRTHLSASGTVGAFPDGQMVWVDPADKSVPLFYSSSGEAVGLQPSTAWNTDVLYSPFTEEEASSVCTLLPNLKDLQDSLSFSIRCLLQMPEKERSTLRIFLQGTDRQGKLLTWESEAVLSCNVWQSATFTVDTFAAAADLNSPCVLTITVDTNGSAGGFWLREIDVYSPAPQKKLPTVGLIIGICLATSFAVTFSIYKISSKSTGKKKSVKRKKRG